MAIKMRNNSKKDSVCCECGQTRKEVLDMFDVCVGDNIFTICDVCNEALFYKTLRAECYKNGRTKTNEDMAIIRKRAQKSPMARIMEQHERERQEAEARYAAQRKEEGDK